MKTDEEKKAKLDEWHETLRQLLGPLISDQTPGLVALRLMIAVRHDDGTLSFGNMGLTGEHEAEAGGSIINVLLQLVVDAQNNRTVGLIDGGNKQ